MQLKTDFQSTYIKVNTLYSIIWICFIPLHISVTNHFLGDTCLQYKINEFMSYTKFTVYKAGVKLYYMFMCFIEVWWLIFCRSTILILLRYLIRHVKELKFLFILSSHFIFYMTALFSLRLHYVQYEYGIHPQNQLS